MRIRIFSKKSFKKVLAFSYQNNIPLEKMFPLTLVRFGIVLVQLQSNLQLENIVVGTCLQSLNTFH
ncbi:hypothetical protein J6590_080059, partial [Homalodisca vitripennis]